MRRNDNVVGDCSQCDQLCQVKDCAEGDEDCVECLQLIYLPYLRPVASRRPTNQNEQHAVLMLQDHAQQFRVFGTVCRILNNNYINTGYNDSVTRRTQARHACYGSSVCPSVCLSHSWAVSKRLNGSSWLLIRCPHNDTLWHNPVLNFAPSTIKIRQIGSSYLTPIVACPLLSHRAYRKHSAWSESRSIS